MIILHPATKERTQSAYYRKLPVLSSIVLQIENGKSSASQNTALLKPQSFTSSQGKAIVCRNILTVFVEMLLSLMKNVCYMTDLGE